MTVERSIMEGFLEEAALRLEEWEGVSQAGREGQWGAGASTLMVAVVKRHSGSEIHRT